MNHIGRLVARQQARSLAPFQSLQRSASTAVSPCMARPMQSVRLYSAASSASDNSGNGNGAKADGAAAASDAAAGTDAEASKTALAEKDKQIANLQDLYRRALADAENVRQRTRREIEEKQTYAIQKFAKELLNTADILTMALDAVPEAERNGSNEHLKSLYTGVSMTRTELLKTFKQFGIESFSPLDEPFDHNLHQALFQAPIPNKKPGTVFQVTKIGYKIRDRVLRPAQVGVVKDE
ncbi:GrpE-domain-containing protein [Entophlyctis helioformis]|nr:GrpE-domain-containing protein [Entophlyctis helioformis]KAI8929315.1 GrpE-domain-containing protein [Entophlyctis helioformis]